ncbi:hypothetical protein ACIQXA_30000 [Streptomyces massasporeus]|uniref:hypothetical protein n=1 Tax=Streptomyces massasporeus TaxID=67324 RepID=UPI00380BF240
MVLRDEATFAGFLDGSADGDGYRFRRWSGRSLVSSNVPFLADIAQVVGARFTPYTNGKSSKLVVADSWPSRGTFQPEHHPLEPDGSSWVEVREVRRRRAEGTKPFTLYSYRPDPDPGFLINGHLARQAR